MATANGSVVEWLLSSTINLMPLVASLARRKSKWLKDRKGRKLTYDDLTRYQHIVSALNETIRVMSDQSE